MSYLQRMVCFASLVFIGSATFTSAVAAPIVSKNVREFRNSLKDEIGKRWYAVIEPQRHQLPTDDIRVYFHVTSERRLKVVRVTPSKPNNLLTKLTLEALAQVKAPPIPRELLATPDQLDIDVGFQFQKQ